MAIYHDQHSSLVPEPDGHWSFQETDAGTTVPHARRKSAGGTRDRIHLREQPAGQGTHRKNLRNAPTIRLLPELRLANIASIQSANAWLRKSSSPATTPASPSPPSIELPPSSPSPKKKSITALPSPMKPPSETTMPSASAESSSTSLRDRLADPTRKPTSWCASISTGPNRVPGIATDRRTPAHAAERTRPVLKSTGKTP